MEFRRRYYNLRKGDPSAEENYDDLLVFGYPCTVFRDDERATWVESGEHLIASPNDNELTIDRYDCRLLLTNPKQYENGHSTSTPSQEEIAEQILCDEERYRDLKDATTEIVQNGAGTNSSSTKSGSAIGFDYKTEPAPISSEMQDDASSDDDDEFVPSTDLKIPADMIIPSSSNQNLVIEKTATFVASQGPQMEIIINAKQKANKRFRFLDYENALHKYYKHVLKMIKEKKYTPKIGVPTGRKTVKKYSDQDSDDSDDDGNYLHPSLMAKPKSVTSSPSAWPVEPSTYKIGEESDVYSELYNRLAVFLPKREEVPSPIETNYIAQPNQSYEQSSNVYLTEPDERSTDSPYTNSTGTVVPPPPDLQPIIDRLAEYVARNGVDFETVVRARHDSRFHFVEPTSIYFPYYCSKITWYQYEHYMSNFYHGGGSSDANIAGMLERGAETRKLDANVALQKNSKPLIDHPWCTAGVSDGPGTSISSQKSTTSVKPKPFTKSQGKTISFSLKSKEKQESNLATKSKNNEFEAEYASKVDSPESNDESNQPGLDVNTAMDVNPMGDLKNENEQDSGKISVGNDVGDEIKTNDNSSETLRIGEIVEPDSKKEETVDACALLDGGESSEHTASSSLQNQRRLKARLFLDSLKRSKELPATNIPAISIVSSGEDMKRKKQLDTNDQQNEKSYKRRRRRRSKSYS